MKKFKNDMAFKETKTFQLYLYSIFFSELFSFEKINSWLWREKKAIGLIYYLACVVVDIWSFLCEYDTNDIEMGEKIFNGKQLVS